MWLERVQRGVCRAGLLCFLTVAEVFHRRRWIKFVGANLKLGSRSAMMGCLGNENVSDMNRKFTNAHFYPSMHSSWILIKESDKQGLFSMPALPVLSCIFKILISPPPIQTEQTYTELIVKFDKALCFLLSGAVFLYAGFTPLRWSFVIRYWIPLNGLINCNHLTRPNCYVSYDFVEKVSVRWLVFRLPR